ncbi:MAG: hypothetical protein AVW06_03345 [Hadesarchaea archaeon DG-33-1]|nr:MAG: hypothetical protein AVW06_03345 [Hadesarchaea archaeon DG-33-1]
MRKAIHVESNLDSLIFNYFCYPQHDKGFLFLDSILNRTNFERKIEILKQICEKEEVELEADVIDSIKFVKDKRNRVTHHEAWAVDWGEGTVLRRLRARKGGQMEQLELTNDLMKQVEEKRLYAIKGLAKVNLELSKHYIPRFNELLQR